MNFQYLIAQAQNQCVRIIHMLAEQQQQEWNTWYLQHCCAVCAHIDVLECVVFFISQTLGFQCKDSGDNLCFLITNTSLSPGHPLLPPLLILSICLARESQSRYASQVPYQIKMKSFIFVAILSCISCMYVLEDCSNH